MFPIYDPKSVYIVEVIYGNHYEAIPIGNKNDFLLGHKGRSVLHQGLVDFVTDIFYVEPEELYHL